MKIDFSFAGLNLNIITQQKRARKTHVLCIMLVKTRGIKYFIVETWMLFAPPIKISGCAPGCGPYQMFTRAVSSPTPGLNKNSPINVHLCYRVT